MNGSQNLIDPIHQLATTCETTTGMLEFKNGPGNRSWIQEIHPLDTQEAGAWIPVHCCRTSLSLHDLHSSIKQSIGAGKVVLASFLPFRPHMNAHILGKVF